MELRIKPTRKLSGELKELWRRRELLYFFAWREVKVRYKQTVIGVSWALLQPLAMMVIFTLFFHRLAGIGSGDTPYPIFVFTGLVFWYYFSSALMKTSSSLVDNQAIITKVYFPRLIPPISASAVPLVDLLCSSAVLVGMMVWFGIRPGLLGVALFLPMTIMLALSVWGAGLALAAINARYRDVQQALPFMVQLIFFLTPIIYPSTLVPEGLRWTLYLNPLTGVISTMRAGLLGYGAIEWRLLALSLLSTLVLLAIGISYFNKEERNLADIL